MKILLILLFYIYYLLNNYNKIDKYNEIKPYLITKNHKNILLNTLQNIHNIFEKNKIFYIIEGGVLLGAVRDKSLIPWDDDADILIFQKDQEKILKLRNEFLKLGHEIKKMDRLLRIYCIKGKKYPFIDLFINKQINNLLNPKYFKLNSTHDLIRCTSEYNTNKYECIDTCCTYPRNFNFWWRYNFKMNNIYPRKKYKLNEITLYGPNNPYPYIFAWYGLSALKTYKFTHNHKSVKQKQITLSKEEYNKLKKYFFN